MKNLPDNIAIRDRQFIRKIAHHAKHREQRAFTKTVQQLAEERMVEIQTGTLYPVMAEGRGRRREKQSA